MNIIILNDISKRIKEKSHFFFTLGALKKKFDAIQMNVTY